MWAWELAPSSSARRRELGGRVVAILCPRYQLLELSSSCWVSCSINESQRKNSERRKATGS